MKAEQQSPVTLPTHLAYNFSFSLDFTGISSVNILHINSHLVFAAQFSSVTQSCPTLCDPMNCSTPGIPVHHQLPESTQTYVHWVGDAIQQSHLLSFPSLPALNLSQHQNLFQWVGSSHQVAKILALQPQHQYFNEHSGLISFRMDWLDLLAVQGTLKGLFQQHSSKASILQHSAFFMVQLSHPYMTAGKSIAYVWDPKTLPFIR